MPSAVPDATLIARFASDVGRLFATDSLALLPAREHGLGLAVSGGPDSLALLLLAHAAFPGRIAAATVDHGLRPDSADDARFVAELCSERDIPHSTLTVTVEMAGEGLQAAARTVRYRALADWCLAEGRTSLLTGHHGDDQAETLVMRLMRGSGVGGLAGIREARDLARDVRLLRPLLRWQQAELAAVVADAGITPLIDPANSDLRHDRTGARALLAVTPSLDPLRLAASAAHLAEAEAALAWAAEREWSARGGRDGAAVTFDSYGLPAELVRRLVLRALAESGGTAPRGAALSTFIETLIGGGVATLAGVRGTGGALWRFALAPPHRR